MPASQKLGQLLLSLHNLHLEFQQFIFKYYDHHNKNCHQEFFPLNISQFVAMVGLKLCVKLRIWLQTHKTLLPLLPNWIAGINSMCHHDWIFNNNLENIARILCLLRIKLPCFSLFFGSKQMIFPKCYHVQEYQTFLNVTLQFRYFLLFWKIDVVLLLNITVSHSVSLFFLRRATVLNWGS